MPSDAQASAGSLASCFHELIVYTTLLKATCARKQPSAAEVRDHVRELLSRSAQRMRALGIDPRDYDEARFAVCAWVDETILNMPWTYREEWLKYLLQSEHYNTTKAGEEFFDRLNLLRPEQVAAREVYFLCLALGFTGRFCAPGDEVLLEQLRRSNLRLLGRAASDMASATRDSVFLETGAAAGGPGAAPRRFWTVPRLIAAVLPPTVALILFLVFRLSLNGVVGNLVGRITGS